MNKKASVSLYLVFLMLSIVMLVMFAVLLPFGIMFNSEMVVAGENIIEHSQEGLDGIKDAEMADAIDGVLNSASENQLNVIEVIGSMYQYTWVFILGVCFVVIFLYTRSLVEIRGNGLV